MARRHRRGAAGLRPRFNVKSTPNAAVRYELLTHCQQTAVNGRTDSCVELEETE